MTLPLKPETALCRALPCGIHSSSFATRCPDKCTSFSEKRLVAWSSNVDYCVKGDFFNYIFLNSRNAGTYGLRGLALRT